MHKRKKIRERERNKEVDTKSQRVGLMRAAAQTGSESERPVRAARRSELILEEDTQKSALCMLDCL